MTTHRKLCNWAFQRTRYWIPKIQDGWDLPSWKSTWRPFFWRGWSDLDKISETGVEWHVDCGDVVEIETRCRIPIWRTFGRIQWHVIPEPRVTLQGAATWWIYCHRVQSPGEINVMIVPHCRVKDFIRHFENRFSAYFFVLMQFRLWRAAAGFRIVSDTLVTTATSCIVSDVGLRRETGYGNSTSLIAPSTQLGLYHRKDGCEYCRIFS